MYKQTNTICKPKGIRLFALIINCTTLKKTNSRFSRNVYKINDRKWCNKHLRHTTTGKYENNGKGGYFRFDDHNNMSYRNILSITYTEMGQMNTYNPIYNNENKRLSIGLGACQTHIHKIVYRHLYVQCLCHILVIVWDCLQYTFQNKCCGDIRRKLGNRKGYAWGNSHIWKWPLKNVVVAYWLSMIGTECLYNRRFSLLGCHHLFLEART